MIAASTRAYVGFCPERSCRCCCSGPVVSLGRTAIFTASGSCCPLSLSNLCNSNSHVAKDCSNLLLSNLGLSSLVRCPMDLVPSGSGIAKRMHSCLYISKPIVCCCLHTVAAAPVVVLMRMYLRLVLRRTCHSPSSIVVAVPRSCASVSSALAVSAACSSAV